MCLVSKQQAGMVRIKININSTEISCSNGPFCWYTVKYHMTIKISWSNCEVIVTINKIISSKNNLYCYPVWLDILQPMGNYLLAVEKHERVSIKLNMYRYTCIAKHLMHDVADMIKHYYFTWNEWLMISLTMTSTISINPSFTDSSTSDSTLFLLILAVVIHHCHRKGSILHKTPLFCLWMRM